MHFGLSACARLSADEGSNRIKGYLSRLVSLSIIYDTINRTNTTIHCAHTVYDVLRWRRLYVTSTTVWRKLVFFPRRALWTRGATGARTLGVDKTIDARRTVVGRCWVRFFLKRKSFDYSFVLQTGTVVPDYRSFHCSYGKYIFSSNSTLYKKNLWKTNKFFTTRKVEKLSNY